MRGGKPLWKRVPNSAPALCLATLSVVLLLCACGVSGEAQSNEEASEAPSGVSEGASALWQDTQGEIDELAGMRASDFTSRLHQSAQGGGVSYTLSASTPDDVTVTVLEGAQDGPVVYVVGGVHGDEPAGWLAGELLNDVDIKAGKVYVLAVANTYGAQRLVRNTRDGWDLNRCFPGDAQGADSRRIAWAIYEDILMKKPGLVLDLHEARPRAGETDCLENTIICNSIEGIESLVMDIITCTEAGDVCSGAFSLYGSPPRGSLNHTVNMQLEIPVITIETGRSKPIKDRVADQMDLMGFILERLGVC